MQQDDGDNKMSNEVNAQVREVIAAVLGLPVEAIADDLAAGDIPEWDSLRHMTVVSALEKRFSIIFSREDLIDAETVADLAALVNAKAGVP